MHTFDGHEDEALQPQVFLFDELINKGHESFLGFIQTFKWNSEDNYSVYTRNANKHVTLTVDEDAGTVTFTPNDVNVETSVNVGGRIYVYPSDTTFPEYSGEAQIKYEGYTYDMGIAEALFKDTFTYKGVTYNVDVPMFED
jgi:hypothetical protein